MTVKLSNGLPVIPQSYGLLIIILLSLCFANSYNGDFVFDDTEAIVNNDDVRDTPLWDIFKNDFWGTKLSHNQSHRSYRPLTILTFRIHFWLKGELNAHDFHIVNIILNTVLCVLLFYVFNILLGSKAQNISLYSTMLFTVHPVHAEAVSGIVGRAELLCALFTWLSILLYHTSIFTKHSIFKWIYTYSCIICVLIAMLCKETGITAIGICAVYDLVVVNKIFPTDLIKFLKVNHSYNDIANFMKARQPFVKRLFFLALITITLLALRFSVMGFQPPRFQPVDNPASFMDNLFLRSLNYSYIYFLNVWLLLCPEWLCFDWSMGCVPLITGYDMRILIVTAFWFIFGTLTFCTFSMKKSRYTKYTIIGLTLIVIPFLPASNIFFNVGFVLAERTLYIPSAGYCLLVVSGLQRLLTRFPLQRILLTAFTILILIFFIRSSMRSNEWRTEKILFRSALRVCPLNAKVHYNIAKNAADAGNSSLAKLEYEEALRLNPNYAQAMNNLGNLLKDQGQYETAINLFKKAVKLQKNFATAWMNLGIVLSTIKKYMEAEESYFTALSHRPKYPDCYYNLGVLYLEQKNYDRALKAWRNATRQKVTHKRAWTNMILLLDDMGMPKNALELANQALRFIPDHAPIYFNIANMLGKAGRFSEAEENFKSAIKRNPGDPIFYTNLGVLYHRWNKVNEAEHMYKKAIEIDPNLQSAKENLKKLYTLKSSIK